MPHEIAPVLRLGRDAVDRIGVLENVLKRTELFQPVGLAPVLAVEMAAAMAGDIVAFMRGKADLLEPLGDFLLRGGKADVGFAGAFARCGVFLACFRRQQEDAGEKVGEMRPGALRQRPAALPLRNVAGAVERDDDDLFRLCRRRWIGLAPAGSGARGEGKRKNTQRTVHRQPDLHSGGRLEAGYRLNVAWVRWAFSAACLGNRRFSG
jgi:hypothetical protein